LWIELFPCHNPVELSSKMEYALLALIELASHTAQKTPLKISEITAKQPIPERYLEQIFTSLRREGLIQSQRGAKGGYILAREPWQITVLEVLMILEGETPSREKDCPSTPTIEKDLVYEVWQQATEGAQAVLDRYTLQDLCQRRDLVRQISPMYYI
jgi:Rrf2 family protein